MAKFSLKSIGTLLGALGAFLAGAGAFWGSYHQHRVFEYEKKLAEQSETVSATQQQLDAAQEELNETQQRLNSSENRVLEIEGDQNTVVITPEARKTAENLARDGQSISETIATALDFMADPPSAIGASPGNTKPGTILSFDERWKMNGVAVTIRNGRRQSTCSGAFLEFDVKIENLTGQGKNLSIQGKNLEILVDGVPQSNAQWSWNATARRNCVEKSTIYAPPSEHLVPDSEPFEVDFLEAHQSKALYYVVFGKLNSTNEEIVVQINDSDPIDGAKWRIPVGDL